MLKQAQLPQSSCRRDTSLCRTREAILQVLRGRDARTARAFAGPAYVPHDGGQTGDGRDGDSLPVASVTASVVAPRVVKREGQHLTQPQAHRDTAAFQPRGLSGRVTHGGAEPLWGRALGAAPRPPGTARVGTLLGAEKAPRHAYRAGRWEREGCPRAPPAPYPSGKLKTRHKASSAEPLPRATDRNILDFTKV